MHLTSIICSRFVGLYACAGFVIYASTRFSLFSSTSPGSYSVAPTCSGNISAIKCPVRSDDFDWKAVLGRDQFSYIQIGAHTGISNSDPLGFLREGARGILVEPIPTNYVVLRKNFGHLIDTGMMQVHNIALCPTAGVLQMYSISAPDHIERRLPDWASQIASLDKSHVLKARGRIKQKTGGIDILPFVKGTRITCQTVSWLLQTNDAILSSLRLVVIDAEGQDGKIVQQFLETDTCPSIIVYEDAHLSPDDKKFTGDALRRHGYTLLRFSKMDALAVRCRTD